MSRPTYLALAFLAITMVPPVAKATESQARGKGVVIYGNGKHQQPAHYSTLISHARIEGKRVRPEANSAVTPHLHHEQLGKISNVAVDWYGTSEVSKKPHAGDKTAVGQHLVEATHKALKVAGLLEHLTYRGQKDPMGAASELRKAYGEAIVLDHGNSKENLGIIYPEIDNRVMWQQATQAVVEAGLFNRAMLNMSARQRDMLGLHYEITTNHTWPQPGVKETFNALAERGFPLQIASNAQFYTPIVAQAHGINIPQLFHSAVYSYRFGHGKPSSALYHALLKVAELPPGGKILYVGNDLLNDIMPIATDPQLRDHFILAWFRGDKLSDRPHQGEHLNLAGGRRVPVDPKYADVVLTDMRQITQIAPSKPFGR